MNYVLIIHYYFVDIFISVFLFVLLRDTAILIALCNALARGLIIPWIPKPLYKTEEKKVTEEGPIKRRRAGPKVPKEKPTSGPILSVDPGGIPDIRAAIEVHFLCSICLLYRKWIAQNKEDCEHSILHTCEDAKQHAQHP